MGDFRRLVAWQEAKRLTLLSRDAILKLPPLETFALGAQWRRARVPGLEHGNVLSSLAVDAVNPAIVYAGGPHVFKSTRDSATCPAPSSASCATCGPIAPASSRRSYGASPRQRLQMFLSSSSLRNSFGVAIMASFAGTSGSLANWAILPSTGRYWLETSSGGATIRKK